MQTTNNPLPDDRSLNEALATEEFDRAFTPKGAIAFFVLLVILGLFIWYGIYFLMLERM
jgi:hypothetical protein